jgi:hypothetical protein
MKQRVGRRRGRSDGLRVKPGNDGVASDGYSSDPGFLW